MHANIDLPPTCITDPPCVHFPHISHAYDADNGFFHIGCILIGAHRVDPMDHGGEFLPVVLIKFNEKEKAKQQL